MDKIQKIYPVILCGGSGSRLWPLSREHYPKQLLKLFGNNTLLQDTLLRVADLQRFHNPTLICNANYGEIIKEQANQIGRETHAVILEPAGRNTAPAIALAAFKIVQDDKDALISVMPSDHVISELSLFQNALYQATELAQQNRIVTLGITPTAPTSQYGYIVSGDAIYTHAHMIKAFVEKPPVEKAKELMDAGHCYWNGGIFVMKAATFLEELKNHAPDVYTSCQAAMDTAEYDGPDIKPNPDKFSAAPSISIDYAVMEHTKTGAVVPMEAGWDDVGSWASIWNKSPKDDHGVAAIGNVMTEDVENAYLYSSSRCLAVAGVKDIIVIETEDTILVAGKEELHKVRDIYDRMKDEGRSEIKYFSN